MSVTNFAVAINNITTAVVKDYTAGSGKLYVANATGIVLNGNQWVRVSTFRFRVPISILKATSVGSDSNGTYLTIAGGTDGYIDVDLLIGDAAELRITAGAFNDISTAINNLESDRGISIGSSVDGPPVMGRFLAVDSSGHLSQPSVSYDTTHPGSITIQDSTYTCVALKPGSTNLNNAPFFQIFDSDGNMTAYFRPDGSVTGKYICTHDTSSAALSDANPLVNGNGLFLNSSGVVTWSNSTYWYGYNPAVWIKSIDTNTLQICGNSSIGGTTYGGLKAGQLSIAGSNSNGVVSVDANGYLAVKVKTTLGAPTDTPVDGAIAINTSENKIYVRTGGVWKSVDIS